MDIQRVIEELVAERNRLGRLIQSLEGIDSGNSFMRPRVSRRGRKSMDGPARLEVSERMKRYWARRRAERAAQANEQGRTAKLHAIQARPEPAEAPMRHAVSA